MFSDSHALGCKPTTAAEISSYLAPQCQATATALGVDVLLLCSVTSTDVLVHATYGVSYDTMCGGPRSLLRADLAECASKYPRPHVHGIADTPLSLCLEKICAMSSKPIKAVYIPVLTRELRFICYGVTPNPDLRLDDPRVEEASSLCDHASLLLATDDLSRRLRITEFFAKEVGHDIASSVQATTAKLRNVSRGIITGNMAMEKIREAEQEIMAAYRVAETLGITVDPNYNIGEGRDFDIVKAIEHAVALYKSEAAERHVEIRCSTAHAEMEMWGNRRAVESAIGQLLLNAIKYARGSSYIVVRAEYQGRAIMVSVTDAGLPLDPEESGRLWEFGARGKRALELHVNGSGIGLYTVKKIVDAHAGRVFCHNASSENVVVFGFVIPERDILKKALSL
jgi:hypothetical protein